MKKKSFMVLALVSLLSLTIAMPAMAKDKVSLVVNGDNVKSTELYQENGVSFVPLDLYSRFAGADVSLASEDTIEITENGTTLLMKLGDKQATLGSKALVMPAAPVKEETDVFIPLRFVSEAFGFNVGWDNSKQQVSLSREELRDGMSAFDLLVKSNQAVMDVDTYSMSGEINTALDTVVDGKKMNESPMKMVTSMEGQYQNNPMQVYMLVRVSPVEEAGIPETVMETYVTESKIYTKSPGQEWIAQDMPFPAEFWKEQQDIQSDPIKAVQQMKDLGMLVNFGNDVVINGQEYYTINSTIDMDKFREGYQDIIDQFLSGLPAANGANPEETQKMMQQVMDSMKMDYFYTAYINKETLISDIIKLDITMEMSIKPSEFPGMAGEGAEGDVPEEIVTSMAMQGEIKIGDLGKPFIAPDISNAVEMAVQ